jgi:hypothetical protein
MRNWKSYIVRRFNATARVIADCLQQKTNVYSSLTKKVGLFIFCGLFLGSSVYVAVHAFNHSITKPLQIQAMPKPVIIPERLQVVPITKSEYERVERYKGQILSFPKTQYDSLLLARPHLMDSIQLFENLYQSQLK